MLEVAEMFELHDLALNCPAQIRAIDAQPRAALADPSKPLWPVAI